METFIMLAKMAGVFGLILISLRNCTGSSSAIKVQGTYPLGTAVKLIGSNEPKMIVENNSLEGIHVRWVQEWNGSTKIHRTVYPFSALTRWDSPLAGHSSQLKF